MPFFILTILILTIGVIMVLSASFARAYIEDGNPTEYFIQTGAFCDNRSGRNAYSLKTSYGALQKQYRMLVAGELRL